MTDKGLEDTSLEMGKPGARAWTKSQSPTRFDLRALMLAKSEWTLGRNPQCDLWFDHPAVSRAHAVVRHDGGGRLFVRDLGSTHGTAIEGRRVSDEVEWKVGEILYLGPVGLRLGPDGVACITLADAAPLVAAAGLGVRHEGASRNALDSVSFELKAGEFVCVLGPSGAGKSTLVECLLGQQAFTSGSLLMNGVPIHHNPAARNGLIGYVPQHETLHDSLTVREAVKYSARLRLPRDTGEQELERSVQDALASMQLLPLADRKIGALSGGERKRASLAAELVVDPAILIVDEATSSLDPASEARVMNVLAEAASRGKLVVCITHHLDNIDRASRLLMLGEGRLVYDGPPGLALQRFGAKLFSDIFVKLEDEGGARWQLEDSAAKAAETASVESSLGLRESRFEPEAVLHQIRVLADRSFRSILGDRKMLLLAGLMPLITGLVVMSCYVKERFTPAIVVTRKLTADEGRVLKTFWPTIRDAARGTGEGEVLSSASQLGYFLGNTPEMKKSLAEPELDTIITQAVNGQGDIFPARRIVDPMPTYKLLAVWMMNLAFMGMLLGTTLMVRETNVFLREREVGVRPIAHLIAKVPFLALASAYQVVCFDGLLLLFFQGRQVLTGLAPPDAGYMAPAAAMLMVHWLATLGCACLGMCVGSLARNADRSLILLGAMIMPQLLLGTAMRLAVEPAPRLLAMVISPVYWGFRASHWEPMEGGVSQLPAYCNFFGERFNQSIPLACLGLLIQIGLYLGAAWLILGRRSRVSRPHAL